MSWFYSSTALDPETIVWRDAIIAAGGSVNAGSVTIADNLIKAIKASPYNSKIIYLLPLLGQDLYAARMPLRDTLGKGICTKVAFDHPDFSQATGLQGNGSSKVLDLLVKPSELGASNNGGIGYWENNVNFTGTTVYQPAGCRNAAATHVYSTAIDAGYDGLFYWGAPGNFAGLAGTGTNGHIYGERSSATSRELFKNGVSIGTNTTNDATDGAGDNNIYVVGYNVAPSPPLFWAGRCAVAYLTDGTMGATNAAAFHSLLLTYLFTPTGRPSS